MSSADGILLKFLNAKAWFDFNYVLCILHVMILMVKTSELATMTMALLLLYSLKELPRLQGKPACVSPSFNTSSWLTVCGTCLYAADCNEKKGASAINGCELRHESACGGFVGQDVGI